MASDEEYMRLCIQLARRGMGSVAPNPMVGAVLVCDGEIVGQGWHRKFGEAHAEINAISSVENKDLLARCTMHVSLEPCAHYGKTPPCALKIIETGIRRVVVGIQDPFPKVNGGGIALLRNAGVDVTCGVLEDECWELNKRFFTFHTKKRPYITLKWAQSADGFLDRRRESAEEKPAVISSDETLTEMHRVRAEETAILVGTNTALLDNPSLTVRRCAGANPVRVLIDRTLRVPTTAKLLDGNERTIVFTEKNPISSGKTEYCQIDFSRDTLPQILQTLYERNLLSLLVEGGGETLRRFLSANLYDELRVETNEALTLGDGVPAPAIPPLAPAGERRFGKNVIRKFNPKF